MDPQQSTLPRTFGARAFSRYTTYPGDCGGTGRGGRCFTVTTAPLKPEGPGGDQQRSKNSVRRQHCSRLKPHRSHLPRQNLVWRWRRRSVNVISGSWLHYIMWCFNLQVFAGL